MLLEAGADPDDGESLYHATEAESPECLRLLLEHGARDARDERARACARRVTGSSHVRLLLEAAPTRTSGALVAHAVRRGRGPEFVRLLAEHGADSTGRAARPGAATCRSGRRTSTRVLRGPRRSGRALAELGASTEVPRQTARSAACPWRAAATPLPGRARPGRAGGARPRRAAAGISTLVVDVVGPDFQRRRRRLAARVAAPPRRLGRRPRARREAARARRRPGARARRRGDTPLAWAAHGSQYHELPDRDYVAVAELLVAAGNDRPRSASSTRPTARSPTGSRSGSRPDQAAVVTASTLARWTSRNAPRCARRRSRVVLARLDASSQRSRVATSSSRI